MKSIVILISGRGSNMQAIIEAGLTFKIAAVISNRPDAVGLVTAQANGIPTATVDHKLFADRETFDQALAAKIDEFAPDLLVLAGFMRILTEGFVNRYRHRIINIHPSLLPAFTGINTHQRALQEGVKVHGCTVHFVTPQLDYGPIIAQAVVPVSANDDEATLSARVLAQEHRLYPAVIKWFCEGRLVIEAERVCVKDVVACDSFLISPRLDT